MKIYRMRLVPPALMFLAILMVGFDPCAIAQCGGDHSSTQGQDMGSSGHMGSGQMGMYGPPTAAQPDQNAGHISPVLSPVPGYTVPQDPDAYGQMAGQGGMASGHSGHKGH